LGRIHGGVTREGGFVLRGYHKLLAMLIVVMLVAGVATVFAKTDKTTPAAKQAPHAATSIVPVPATSGGAESPAPTNSLKKNPMDELANAPMSPDTGVPNYPIGFVLVGAAAMIGVFVRRLVRA